jgi:hypothetical protein
MSELVRQMRLCAASKPSEFEPHWEDAARRLLIRAADTIDAADFALLDYCEQLRVAQERIRQFENPLAILGDQTLTVTIGPDGVRLTPPAESTEGK